MNRPLLLALVITHAAAWGDPPTSERTASISRLSVTYGGAFRSSDQIGSLSEEKFSGFAPSVLHASGAFFFRRWLGVALDLSGEWFGVAGTVDPVTGKMGGAWVAGFRVLPSLDLRWAPRPFFSLEAHLGVGGGTWPSYSLASSGDAVVGSGVGYVGPFMGLTLAFEPDAWVGGQLFARGGLHYSRHEGAPLSMLTGSAGGQLFIGNLELADVRAAIVVEYEITGGTGGNGGQPEGMFRFVQTQQRVGLGLRFRQEGAALAAAVAKPATGVLKGHVLSEGAGVANATVEAQGKQAISDATGAFELPGVSGAVQARASAVGYRTGDQVVEVPRGGEATVTFDLVRPTGPGTVRGFVKSDKPEGPIEGAEVTAEGRPPVRSAADGSFTVEKAGPGPVKVSAKAKGFANGEEIVQVPPEAEATVTFTLAKQGEKAPATIRGVVRAASGKAVKASVRITELNLNVQVKADGRFVVQVPGGKYTLVIDAPGYVAQSKPLEVADGDQAIFHCELQPVGR